MFAENLGGICIPNAKTTGGYECVCNLGWNGGMWKRSVRSPITLLTRRNGKTRKETETGTERKGLHYNCCNWGVNGVVVLWNGSLQGLSAFASSCCPWKLVSDQALFLAEKVHSKTVHGRDAMRRVLACLRPPSDPFSWRRRLES